MEIIKYTQENTEEIIQKAIQVLNSAGLFVYPTETCYGLAADVSKPEAVAKLLKYKSRREGKPFSIVVSDLEMAKNYIKLNKAALNIFENYLPGPITVVAKSLGKLAKGIESEFGTLAIRVPDYPLILEIAKRYGKAFTATSANLSYKKKPYSIETLLKDTNKASLDLIDLIIDAGKLPTRQSSSVIDTSLDELNLLRSGNSSLSKQLNSSVLSIKSKSVEESINFASLNLLKYLDYRLKGPLVFLLMGELGAGKTHFTKGLARSLKIKELIKSPSFNIVNEHPYSLAAESGILAHFDLWRLETAKDLDDLALENYLKTNNILAIEWADKFANELELKLKGKNIKIIKVFFKYLSENEREIKTYE